MAVAAAGVWEIRTTGASTNGGGFVTGASGVDYSQQAAAQYSLTGLTTAGAAALIATTSAAADMVGNIIQITAGTNFTVGWYQILSVVVGVSITVDRNATTGVGAAGTGSIGGAFAFGGSNEDAFFETMVGGNICYIKAGTHTNGAIITIAAAGGASAPIKVIGYNATRGDNPTGATRPIIATAANTFTFGANWDTYYIQMTGTAASVLTLGASNKLVQCKVTNSSSTAFRFAVTGSGTGGCILMGCEAICYRGSGINASSLTEIWGCYIHDSNQGIAASSTSCFAVDNIIANCITNAVSATSTLGSGGLFLNNTIYGAENKIGVGFLFATGVTNVRLLNNILYGLVTGVTHADTQTVGYDDYNNYFNNTNDVSAAGQWQKGPHDTALNPGFTNVAQLTGATATTTAGNHLVQAGATFVASGVVAGRDFLYIKSGTGVTVGIYGIASVDSATQITTDITLSADATADKVWQIMVGQNFAVGSNMKAIAYPGTFPGGLTTGYQDAGAAQRQESVTTAYGFVG